MIRSCRCRFTGGHVAFQSDNDNSMVISRSSSSKAEAPTERELKEEMERKQTQEEPKLEVSEETIGIEGHSSVLPPYIGVGPRQAAFTKGVLEFVELRDFDVLYREWFVTATMELLEAHAVQTNARWHVIYAYYLDDET